jgi:hypothetical protein
MPAAAAAAAAAAGVESHGQAGKKPPKPGMITNFFDSLQRRLSPSKPPSARPGIGRGAPAEAAAVKLAVT